MTFNRAEWPDVIVPREDVLVVEKVEDLPAALKEAENTGATVVIDSLTDKVRRDLKDDILRLSHG